MILWGESGSKKHTSYNSCNQITGHITDIQISSHPWPSTHYEESTKIISETEFNQTRNNSRVPEDLWYVNHFLKCLAHAQGLSVIQVATTCLPGPAYLLETRVLSEWRCSPEQETAIKLPHSSNVSPKTSGSSRADVSGEPPLSNITFQTDVSYEPPLFNVTFWNDVSWIFLKN